MQDPLLLFIYGESDASDAWGNNSNKKDAITLDCGCYDVELQLCTTY